MAGQIGKSTDPGTATKRFDINGSEPASFRYNNPGAQFPSAAAARFGQLGFGMIGGGQFKIAAFPSQVNGAACNLDLLTNGGYVGKTIGEAGKKWTGGNGFGVPGFDSNKTLTKDMLTDPTTAIPFLKAIAARESGHGNNLTEEQWRQAHQMYLLGSADAFLATVTPTTPAGNVTPAPKSGAAMVELALKHIGEEYRNVQVPKDNAGWTGPWDCAEFASWLVFQEAGALYGCLDDSVAPSKADAFTGAWKTDSARLGKRVSIDEAAGTAGAFVLRFPPSPGAMGHIAICDGKGGTIEAKGRRFGVIADTVHGRPWDTGVLVPGIQYGASTPIEVKPPGSSFKPDATNMDKATVVKIQMALAGKGFSPGDIDGEFGPDTESAVIAFQTAEGLTIDGIVGPETAAALGISLTGGSDVSPPGSGVGSGSGSGSGSGPVQGGPGDPGPDVSGIISILQMLTQLFGQSTQNGGATMPSTSTNPASTDPNNPLFLFQEVAKFLQALQQQQQPPQQGTPGTPSTPADQQIDFLGKIIGLLLPIINPNAPRIPGTTTPSTTTPSTTTPSTTTPSTTTPLGQVNGALGSLIGNLLNGNKTAIGGIGTLLTSLLANTSLSKPLLDLLPQAAGLSQFALPIFVALTGWGILGKFEKWAQGNVPLSGGGQQPTGQGQQPAGQVQGSGG